MAVRGLVLLVVMLVVMQGRAQSAAADYVKANILLSMREGTKNQVQEYDYCPTQANTSLICRPVTLTLKNIGTHDVLLGDDGCLGPYIWFEMKRHGDWVPVPSPHPWVIGCGGEEEFELLIPAGGQVDYPMRLGWVSWGMAPFLPGTYKIRARWQLDGCVATAEPCPQFVMGYDPMPQRFGVVISNAVKMKQAK